MATEAAAGAIKHEAEVRILEILETHGDPELVENMRALGSGSPTRDPWLAAAATSRMIASLAEIVADQATRIEKLEKPANSRASGKKGRRAWPSG